MASVRVVRLVLRLIACYVFFANILATGLSSGITLPPIPVPPIQSSFQKQVFESKAAAAHVASEHARPVVANLLRNCNATEWVCPGVLNVTVESLMQRFQSELENIEMVHGFVPNVNVEAGGLDTIMNVSHLLNLWEPCTLGLNKTAKECTTWGYPVRICRRKRYGKGDRNDRMGGYFNCFGKCARLGVFVHGGWSHLVYS